MIKGTEFFSINMGIKGLYHIRELENIAFTSEQEWWSDF
jgi:hypothetical protein